MTDHETLFRHFSKLIVDIHNLETDLMVAAADRRLTPLQHQLTQILFFHSPRNLSSVSHCLNINLPNTSREVKKLIQMGLVTKTVSASDRRSVDIKLTQEGRDLVEGVLKRMIDRYAAKVGPLDEEILASALEAINRVDALVVQPGLEA